MGKPREDAIPDCFDCASFKVCYVHQRVRRELQGVGFINMATLSKGLALACKQFNGWKI